MAIDYHTERMNHAIGISRRSPMKYHRTGAALFDGRNRQYNQPIAVGWSHYTQLNLMPRYRSIHAELHVLTKIAQRGYRTARPVLYIATVRVKSGNIGTANPCAFCEELLYDAGIFGIYFTIGQNNKMEWVKL